MSIESKEFFSKNKIQEAICQFTFKSPLDLKSMDELSKALTSTDRYTIIEQLPFFQFNFNLGNPSESNVNQTQQLSSFKILNSAGDKVIQLFSNNLSIHQIGNYENWQKFREDIQYVLEKFSGFYDVEIARIDLRAINNFDFINLKNIKEYFRLSIDVPSGFEGTNAVSFSIEQVLEPNKTFVAVRANYNTIQNCFLLDLNFIVFADSMNLKTTSKNEIGTILDNGNLKLYNIFVSSLTDAAKKIIK